MKAVTLTALYNVRKVKPRGQSSYMIHDGAVVTREKSTLLYVNIWNSHNASRPVDYPA